MALFALTVLSAGASVACAASISRSVDVNATPAAVWSVIGSFCAIKDWLPPVGTCSVDGKNPPTRTLTTKDGKATFIERQSARSDTRHFYSYTFLSSPLPVSNYSSTLQVVSKGNGEATVIWRATYTPAAGKEKAADEALQGIYKAGLESIKARVSTQASVGSAIEGQP